MRAKEVKCNDVTDKTLRLIFVMSYLTRCLFSDRGTQYFLIATQRTTKRPESGIGERDSKEEERLSKKVSGIARKRSRTEIQGQELCVCVLCV